MSRLSLAPITGAGGRLAPRSSPRQSLLVPSSRSATPTRARRAAGLSVTADPELSPFADASFDLIVSSLVLHWTADLPGALAQLRRALRPDGLFLAAMLGGQTLIELRTALFEARKAEVENKENTIDFELKDDK